MKKLITIITLVIAVSTSAQNNCARKTALSAEFAMQFNTKINRVNATLNFGSNGLSYTNYRFLGVAVGAKVYDEALSASKDAQFKTYLTPTTTLYFNYRNDGEYSKVVHTFAVTSGLNNYVEYSYRVCANPLGNSFATVGFTTSYNTKQGYTAGFVIVGMF